MFRRLLAAFALTAVLAVPAAAQPYPNRTVRIIVPSGGGDAGDLIARMLAQKLSERFGQQFFVENRGGAGGRIGTEQAAQAPKDGYTLLFANAGSHGINGALYKELKVDLVADFTPIVLVATSPNLLVVHPSFPAATPAEFIAAVKARPGKLDYASGGNGTSSHLSMELLKHGAGLDLNHVPYRGASAALNAVVTGEPSLAIINMPPAVQHVTADRLRAIAVTTAQRSALMPEVPTLAEAGLPGYETVAWFGALAPAGVPVEVVTLLHGAIRDAASLPDIRERLAQLGAEPQLGSSAEFGQRIARDLARWKEAVRISGATVD